MGELAQDGGHGRGGRSVPEGLPGPLQPSLDELLDLLPGAGGGQHTPTARRAVRRRGARPAHRDGEDGDNPHRQPTA
ncbi:hypothetical protein KDA82_18555 [Streptomyces daliensis]|uniref:Uncharacterized protein n=1 Tax=Streptomyces daliensis TaxID=299421 RepID=A0A8T4J0A6_9ACTN|nr:hypothetical protein [Streptomyces daliensis]